MVYELAYTPPIREDIEWVRLEQTFDGGTSSAPSAHRYFTALYYLFPCNVIRFLRYPVRYLSDSGLDSPYTIGWDEALDEDKIRSTSEPLMRGHTLHPLLIWRGAVEELSQPDFWTQYDIPRIVGECTMLDMRNAALGIQQRAPAVLSTDPVSPPSPVPVPVVHPSSTSAHASLVSSPTIRPEELSMPALGGVSGKPRVSLQDMISVSVALKSGLDVEVVHPSTSWSAGSISSHPTTRSPSLDVVREETEKTDVQQRQEESAQIAQASTSGQPTPTHIGQALAGLQREVLLLRNELNFELWNARENVKHIGRLYQDRVLSKTAEVERQGLHNKLREYKAEVFRFQRELKEHKEHATTMKHQYMDWNQKMQDKLMEFRTEKKSWMAEAAALRAADQEAKDTFAAQGKLLADAVQRVFQLETKIKEDAHKIDRLHDYEKQIEQLVKLQRLWELDVQKLNDQAEYLQVFTSKYRKMELRLESYEQTQSEMEQAMQNYRFAISSLEAQLAISQRQLEGARKGAVLARHCNSGDVKRLAEANQRLRDENSELRDEVEEVTAMVEVLKARGQGLVFDGRQSRSGSGTQEQLRQGVESSVPADD
ncbi:uncharacterized protein FIBRA_04488 [Fibroporia radiculosa]|uniref:Uncharacterized protein n=1 Tax=Fibroporia radiculosa TaxID=599839 RepID=J4GPC3_9APHY|nr:uncharacterized protein FIBRA_04488 [Fibroporia radiculosa]CCM02390.1 predicted protein [Fibroporia radiculosa]